MQASSEYQMLDIKSAFQNPPSSTNKSISEETTSSPVRMIDAKKRNLETLAKGVEYHPPSAEKISKLFKDHKKRSSVN